MPRPDGEREELASQLCTKASKNLVDAPGERAEHAEERARVERLDRDDHVEHLQHERDGERDRRGG